MNRRRFLQLLTGAAASLAAWPVGVWRDLWAFIWLLSELTDLTLGRFAPWVFGQMIGRTGRKV